MAFDAYMIDCTELIASGLDRFTGAGVNEAAWSKSGDMLLYEPATYRFESSGAWQGGWASNGEMLSFSIFDDASFGLLSFEKPYFRAYSFAGYMYPLHVSALPVISGDSMHEIVFGLCADFTFSIVVYDVYFTDLSTSGAVSWLWDFGDGVNSTDQNPIYQYTAIGVYLVTLMVTWPDGYVGYSQDWITITKIKRSGIFIIGVV
jgi:hypothetical protein